MLSRTQAQQLEKMINNPYSDDVAEKRKGEFVLRICNYIKESVIINSRGEGIELFGFLMELVDDELVELNEAIEQGNDDDVYTELDFLFE